MAAATGTKPAVPRTRSVWSGWANARNDAGDLARCAALLKSGMRPVRPVGRPVPRILGQLHLF